MNHISIIIVNYNSGELTNDCLQSLQQLILKKLTIQIIVVDNGSQVPYQLPTKYEDSVTLLRSSANLGFTGGNNLGIHHAIETFNSDYILLLNNDTVMEEHSLQILFEQLSDDESCGLACPKIYFARGREYHFDNYGKDQRGSILWYGGGSVDWLNLTAFHRGVDEVDRGQFSYEDASEFATGCCVLIKREVLEKIGLLDKRYFLYFEDTDLSMRAQSFGYNIKYCDSAVVWHVNAGSSDGAGSPLHLYYQTRNRLLFFWEYGSWRTRITLAKLALKLLLKGSKMERTGAAHFLTQQFGKQPIV